MPENKNRTINYTSAINEALALCMRKDDRVIIIGEGVPDPKAIFTTTKGLREEFGKNRVFDMPLSENGITGVCIGAALMGMRPVMVHQRVDFALLAMDQLVNNAAKWHYMFNGQSRVPLVVRLIIGRGWGQGPQHSQSLHSFFSHIPGLKVVMPSKAKDAKGMLISAIEDDNPVLFIEHRWLHHLNDNVPEEHYKTSLSTGRVIREGTDVTIVAFSYMVVEAIRVANKLAEYGIEVEVIDMSILNPLDTKIIIQSVKKTGYLMVLDPDWKVAGISSEIISQATEHAFHDLKSKPIRITYPEHPVPTTRSLTDYFYPDASDIVKELFGLIEISNSIDTESIVNDLTFKSPKDIPDNNFTGPF